MSINDLTEKIKPFYTTILIILVAFIFFCLGRLSALESRHTPIKIQYSQAGQSASAVLAGDGIANGVGVGDASSAPETPATPASSGQVIGSKSGKKYYFPWCGTLKRVKPENQVPFASITEARAAGYTPAGNCKGLQ